MSGLAILLGWPSLIAGFLLAAIGTLRSRPSFIWASFVLALPMALYVSASPRFPLAGLVPLLALVVAAKTCGPPVRWSAWLGITVFGASIAALALVVLG